MKLELINITKKIGETAVLEGFNYTFFDGEVYLILGNNGSGKTTLLKCISSLYLPDEGSIRFQDIAIDNRRQLNFYRRNVSFFVSSSNYLVPTLTILQNIKFFLGINDMDYDAIKQRVIELLEKFNLTENKNKQIKILSKGMKQKVALMIAFLKEANVLLLDEPFDGLDTRAIEVLNMLIESYSKKKIIILTSPNKIDTVATKIINLD